MAKLTSSEVVDRVTNLIMDFAVLDGERRDALDVYNLQKAPLLPQDLAREAQVDMLSDELRDAVSVISSDVLSFGTSVECLPTAREPGGAIPAAHKRKADTLEKADSIFLARIHAGRRLKHRIIWRMAVEQLACVMFECYAIEELDDLNHSPYHAFDLDLGGVGFTDIDLVPQQFGWNYKRQVGEVMKSYTRRDNPKGKGHVPVWDGKSWDWVSEDYDVTTSRNGEEVEIYFYADSEYLYHVGLDKGEHRVQIGPVGLFGMKPTKGEILWCGENPFGRVPVVLYPGFETPQREVHLRFEPFLRPLKTTIEKRNYEQTVRATRSRNLAAPQDYINTDGETAREYLRQGGLPAAHVWEDGVSPYFPGRLEARPMHPDPDLDKLGADIREEMERYRPSNFAQTLDAETARAATASVVILGLEGGQRRLAPFIGTLDSGDQQLIEMMHHTQKYYGDSFEFDWASAEGAGYGAKDLKDGDVVHLDAEALDFPHTIRVTTASKTNAQEIAEYELAVAKMMPLPDGSPGVGTREDVMRAAGITDSDAQNIQKAEELIMATADADIRQWATIAIKEEIALGSDIDIDLMTSRFQQSPLLQGLPGLNGNGGTPLLPPGGGPGAAPPPAPPAPGTGPAVEQPDILGRTMGSPVTNAVQGGSGANVGQSL